MSADTSKQSGHDTETPSVVQSKENGRATRMPGFARFWANKKVLYVLLAIAVVLAGWLIVKKLHIGEKVYAQAAGHKVYKKEIDDLIDGNSTFTAHKAAVALADKYLTEAMAEQHHVTVSRAEIKAYVRDNYYGGGDINAQQAKPPRYVRQVLVNQLYFTRLAADNVGSYKGKLLVANFSRNVPYESSVSAEDKAANPRLGNSKAIAADKKYALNFITKLYKQMKAKKITFDQAIRMEHKDPVVGEKAYPTQSHSESFDGPLSQSNLLNAKSIRHKLQNVKLHKVTSPFVVKTPNSAYDKNSTAATYYLVVRIDERSGGGYDMNFPKELAQAKKELGYKINV